MLAPRRRARSSSCPEIALTPQIVSRFVARFGDTVAVLHSKLSKGERYDEWQRLRRGEARVCVGPRSAVFAPIARPRAHRGRRGARPLLQARGRPALRRPPRGRAARRDARRAARRRRGPESVARAAARPAARARRRRDAAAASTCSTCARSARALHPETVEALHARAQGDRPAQPPRLVELPHLPVVRPRVDVPRVRRLARPAPRRRACSPATTAATARGCPSTLPGRASRSSVARHGAGTERLEARARAGRAAGVAPGRRRRAARRRPAGVRGGADRRARRHADGRQGPRLPRRDARRRARRRRDAALPRLPRRGAHVRAGRPARRPRGPRQRRRPRARAGAVARTRRRSATPPSTTPTASSPASSSAGEALRYPPFSSLVRVVCSSAEPGAAHAAAAGASRERLGPGAAGSCSAPRRCSACAAASAASS